MVIKLNIYTISMAKRLLSLGDHDINQRETFTLTCSTPYHYIGKVIAVQQLAQTNIRSMTVTNNQRLRSIR